MFLCVEYLKRLGIRVEFLEIQKKITTSWEENGVISLRRFEMKQVSHINAFDLIHLQEIYSVTTSERKKHASLLHSRDQTCSDIFLLEIALQVMFSFFQIPLHYQDCAVFT